MPVRVFSEDEKKQIRKKLLSVGFPLLQEYGLVHMSIPKIAAAAQIGTGTFYRFFKSKEAYIYELIAYRRRLLLEEVIAQDVRSGTRKLTKDEVRAILRLVVDEQKSIYPNLDLMEEAKLFENIKAFAPDLEKERQIAEAFLSLIEHPKETIDFPVLLNMVKLLAIASQTRNELHPQGYDRTIERFIDMILSQIYDQE